MGKCYTFMIMFCSMFAVNGTSTPDPRKNVFKSTPHKSNPVLVGRNITLQWSFALHSVSDLQQIRLFTYDSKSKISIASKDVKSGVLQYSPIKKGYQGRYLCEISFTENGIGKASILIRNVQFNHTNDYGVILKRNGQHLPAAENSVSVKVVDMIRGDKSKDSRVIRSWFGQTLFLRCDVIYHRNTRPLFKWYKKSFTATKRKNLFAPNNSRILDIKNVNTTDFGEYTCEAKTTRVKVEQNFIIDKLGYASAPRNVKFKYYPNTKSYALYWEQPSTKDGHWVRKYILEEWNADKNAWVIQYNITTLHVTIKKIQSATKFRVCSANEIGYKDTSCSEPVSLPKTVTDTSDERGKSNHVWPSVFLVIITALLSSALPLHQ